MQFDREGSGRVTGQDESHRYLWGPAVDEILADERLSLLPGEEGAGYDVGSPASVVWPLADHIGTVRDLAEYDAQSGTTVVVSHRVYDAFGNLRSETASAQDGPSAAAVDFLFGFTGRPFDAATGLQNNLNRWYDPAVGRWLSPDPLGLSAGDPNLFRYIHNSPGDSTDPTGLYWNWGNPFSGWMWNMWYYSEIDKERREWILEHSIDPGALADNLRPAQRTGPGENGMIRGLAETGVHANAVILSGAFVRPSAPGELRPYGSSGGGHHVPAKGAFAGAPRYNASKALGIPDAELARLGIKHSAITAAQQALYRELARSGVAPTWEVIERIETQALIKAGMNPEQAAATVQQAIQALKDAGVTASTRIPWGAQ